MEAVHERRPCRADFELNGPVDCEMSVKTDEK